MGIRFGRTELGRTAFGCALVIACLPCVASAQAPAPAPAIAAPTYVTIFLEVTVNRPTAEVWKRVGKYCDVGEWAPITLPPCTITSGKDGEIGAVRSIGGEVLVGKSALSYTYTQTVKIGQPYNLYHATLEARPVTPTTSKLTYTLFFDNSMLPDDAAREKDKAQRSRLSMKSLENMKIVVEGGKLPAKVENQSLLPD